MSGTSEVMIDREGYQITFGHRGNDLLRCGLTLAEMNTGADYDSYTEELTTRQELIDLGAENLADMILGWVKNGREI